MAIVDVTTFGASPAASITVNRDAFQAAVDACQPGDTLYVPAGTYRLARQAGSSNWSVLIQKDLKLLGAGQGVTIIGPDATETATPAVSHQLFWFRGCNNIEISHITFDGAKPSSNTVTAYDSGVEQKALLFVGSITQPVNGLYVHHATFQNSVGDGTKLYANVSNVIVEDVNYFYNQRDGISFAPPDEVGQGRPAVPVQWVLLQRVTALYNSVQCVDNEHGPAYDVEITDCLLTSALNDYVIAFGGSNPDGLYGTYSMRWYIHHNTLNGPIATTRAQFIRIEYNTGVNATTKPCVESPRATKHMLVQHNQFEMTQTTVAGVPCLWAWGTGVEDFPFNIRFLYNRVKVAHPNAVGIQVDNFDDQILVEGNDVEGAATGTVSGNSGIHIRNAAVDRPSGRVRVANNIVRNFAQRGISFFGAGSDPDTAVIEYAEVEGNYCYNTNGGNYMIIGVSVGDTSHPVTEALVLRNRVGTGITIPIHNQAQVSVFRTDIPESPKATWSVSWGAMRPPILTE